jgi:hypothetical protein
MPVLRYIHSLEWCPQLIAYVDHLDLPRVPMTTRRHLGLPTCTCANYPDRVVDRCRRLPWRTSRHTQTYPDWHLCCDRGSFGWLSSFKLCPFVVVGRSKVGGTSNIF